MKQSTNLFCLLGTIPLFLMISMSCNATIPPKAALPDNKKEKGKACKPTKNKPCPPEPAKTKPLLPVFALTPLTLPISPMKIMPKIYTPLSLPDINLEGKVRVFDFIRNFTNPLRLQQASFSAGGSLTAYTDTFWDGFKLLSTGYAAEPFGLNNPNPARQDVTLPGTQLEVIGQAYGEYKNSFLLVRGGDQIITTPWANASDIRMIPATYQGILATVTPVTGLDVSFIRMLSFKSRTSSKFNKTNLYNPINVATPLVKLGDYHNPGFLTVGAQYSSPDWATTSQLWGYQFYNFSKMLYGDFNYIFNQGGWFKPLAGVQFVRSTTSGANILRTIGQGSPNGTGYGFVTGFVLDNFEFNLAFNEIRQKQGAFKGGDIVSPYTSGYITDPLYTTSMIQGLIEKAAGKAFKIGAAISALDQQVFFKASYAIYRTEPYFFNTTESYFDFIYTPKVFMNIPFDKSLSLRYRLAFLNGIPDNGQFTWGRLMIEYDFS